ncbi:MAG: ribonuclease HII, partial [Bacteroidales bacterium]
MDFNNLLPYYKDNCIEAGCDEAGRGCLAGPVFAAAVILPENFKDPGLNDSKKISQKEREKLRLYIESKALSFAIGIVDNKVIDKVNILNA